MEQLIQREDEILSKFRKPVQMKGDEEVMMGNYDSAPKLYGELFSIGIRTSISLEEDELELKGFGTTYIGTDPEDRTDWLDPGQVDVIVPGRTYVGTDPDDMLDFYLDPGHSAGINVTNEPEPFPIEDLPDELIRCGPKKGDWGINRVNTIDNTLYAYPENMSYEDIMSYKDIYPRPSIFDRVISYIIKIGNKSPGTFKCGNYPINPTDELIRCDPEKGDWNTIDNTLYAEPIEWLDDDGKPEYAPVEWLDKPKLSFFDVIISYIRNLVHKDLKEDL